MKLVGYFGFREGGRHLSEKQTEIFLCRYDQACPPIPNFPKIVVVGRRL